MRMNYAVCHVVASDSSNIHACSHIGGDVDTRDRLFRRETREMGTDVRGEIHEMAMETSDAM